MVCTVARPLRLLAPLLALLLAALAPRPSQAETLVLNTDGAPPHSRTDGTGFEDRIMAEAFRRIGVAVRLVQLPSERALQNLDQGIDDGCYVRIAGLSAQYPNIVMVPEPASEYSFTAFTKDPTLRITGWSDLKPHSVGIVTGWKLVERNVRGVRQVIRVRDEESLFAMLDAGHATVVVGGLRGGQEIIRRRGYRGIRTLLPPLASPPMYVYLHKRHAELVPRLAQALRDMKRDGTARRLQKAGLEDQAP